MKRAILLTASAMAVGICLPLWFMGEKAPGKQETEDTAAQTTSIIMESVPVTRQSTEPTEPVMSLQVLTDTGVEEMELESYLVGVLLAEMPTTFQPEALKAQAVVARTYTLRRTSQPKHDNADVCTDSNCCQGWKDPETYEDSAGAEAARQAVQQTEGEVLTYGGDLIDATFFSASGGRTEAAVEVWGGDVPYLQSVESPGEDSPYEEDQVVYSLEEFRRLILEAAPEADLSGSPETWFREVKATEGGGVESLQVGGVSLSGTTLRSVLGLRSTVFSVSVTEEKIFISTKGFGHRVGMSQYGAEAMACNGSTYEEILYHYYQGVTLEAYE